MNLLALLFQYLRGVVKETREGSKKTRSWIPLGMLVFDIMMHIKLIDSLTEYQITRGIEPQVQIMCYAKTLKNMGIITELISEPAEIPKEYICNRRVHLEYFLIFYKPNPLGVVIGFLDSCQAGAILSASEKYF